MFLLEDFLGIGCFAFTGFLVHRRCRPKQINSPGISQNDSSGRLSVASNDSDETFHSAVSGSHFGSAMSSTVTRVKSTTESLAASFGVQIPVIQESLVPNEAELKLVVELREHAMSEGIADTFAGGQRWYEDGELLRYVRARPTMDDRKALFREAMVWRVEHTRLWGIESAETGSFGAAHAELLSTTGTREGSDWWTFLRANMPLDLYGSDRDGLPISYFALGNADMPGLVREVGIEAVRQYCVYQNDYFFDSARTATKNAGEILLGGVVIVDMEGLGWMDMKAKADVCIAMGEQAKWLHPERQRRSFVVRAPRSFSVMWKIASTVLDPRTVAKISILSGSDIQPVFDELGAENVPDFLGGTCRAVSKRPTTLDAGAFTAHQARISKRPK